MQKNKNKTSVIVHEEGFLHRKVCVYKNNSLLLPLK